MSGDRRRFVQGGLAGIAASALGAPGAVRASASRPESPAAVPDVGRHFRERGVDGTFVLLAVDDDTLLVHDARRADEPLLPASTFKIPNSLIALETGAVADEREILKWDGERRWLDEWNRDHDMRSAIAVSAVWFYQELARRIGTGRMQAWLERLDYGNRDISGGIDAFWLRGGLRISARQQVEFLRRLYLDDLPCSARALRIVKDILVMERTDDYVLRGKTGLTNAVEPGVAWLVGWVERGARAWLFACNIAMREETDIALRRTLPLGILSALGLRG